jgi:hypothetical protein
MKNAQMFL